MYGLLAYGIWSLLAFGGEIKPRQVLLSQVPQAESIGCSQWRNEKAICYYYTSTSAGPASRMVVSKGQNSTD
jgi:hypothetical protein